MHICPKCGASEGMKKFVGPFCIDCYKFRLQIPGRIGIEQCKRCGKMKMRGEWISFSEKKISDYAKGKFRGEYTSVDFSPRERKAKFAIERDGAKIEIEKEVNFGLVSTICSSCNRRSGGYFEAIIQLRGEKRRIEKYARIFEKELEGEGTFISRIAEGKDGLDLYVGSTKAVLSVIKGLGLTYKISTTLAGQKQGKRLYRTTFAIRL